MATIKHLPDGHDFFEPVSYLVKKVDLQRDPVGQPFRVEAQGIDASSWPPRYIPGLPTMASARKHGTVLRANSLRGCGGEDAILAMALNTHFQCASPEGWHFVTVQAKQNKKAAALQRELRLLSGPDWFHTHLSDLISHGQLALCRGLPRPEEDCLSSQERASHWQQMSVRSKRQRISDGWQAI